MRIAFVCSEYPPGPHGGIGTVTQVLARGLVQAGHEVRVVGVYHQNYGGKSHEVDQGVTVWRLGVPLSRLDWITSRRLLYRTVKEWVQRSEVDLVEVPDWGGEAAFWPALSVPVVARLHGSESYFARESGRKPARMMYWLERNSLNRMDGLCSVTRYAGDLTREIFHLGTRPIEVLYNSVEVQSGVSDLSKRSTNTVVFGGTLTPKKGVISLIDAWPIVRKALPQAELHLYGKDGRAPNGGSMTEFLRERLSAADRGSVQFCGRVPREKLFEALSRARVAVYPSFSESFGLAPVEAMMCGCPTIYTSLSCGPEIIRDGEDGLLANPNEPGTIAEAITRLLTDSDLASQLAQQGRTRALALFAADEVLKQNVAFYERTIEDFKRQKQ
jgi:glycosyltransferase involved in cell wall biosynthesis